MTGAHRLLAAHPSAIMPVLLRTAAQPLDSDTPAAFGGTAAAHQLTVSGFQMHPAAADASLQLGAVLPAPGATAEAGGTWVPASLEVGRCCLDALML